ncbi:MAG: SDR family oxidoreductase, partial [Proteobacteria bacterium]|nr:SDR family oxidoreductase [Pseudomonadota bacterium]
MGRLEGKSAVVLGAAGRDNMGQVMARTFAREGARVMVAGRHEGALSEIATEIGGRYVTCDITKKAEVEALANDAVAAFGKIDIAVNCTGWGLMAKLLDTTEEQLNQLAALQFKGPYFFLQSFVGRMAKSGGGSVINISSASVHAVLNNHAA